jgi:organic radical activating enzyme
MDLKESIQSIRMFFTKKEPFQPGLYTYQSPPESENPYRLHLRIEKDGSGILVINASTVLHLNQTAAEYAFHITQRTELEKVVKSIAARYNVDPKQVRLDFENFQDKVETLIQTPDLDPVTYLDIERQEPYTDVLSAPYRLDCALTYRLSPQSPQDSAPLYRVDRELTTEEWKAIIQTAFDKGIPHLIFTGGEPTLRDDLPELLAKAEDLGLVTGVLTDGLRLLDDVYRQQVLVNGLDHLLIVLDPENKRQWESLDKILPEDVFTAIHLTLKNDHDLKPTIQKLAEMGANALSLSAASANLAKQLEELRDLAAILQLNLVWDLPVPYSKNNPVSLELEKSLEFETPDGAGKAWLYIEPDGDVLPAQGMYDHILGNILNDSWEVIWNKK